MELNIYEENAYSKYIQKFLIFAFFIVIIT